MKLRPRFMVIKFVFSILAVVAIGTAGYGLSVRNAMDEAKQKGKMIFNFMTSQNKYMKENQRPLIEELIDKQRFYPEIMSGFAVSRGIWDIFSSSVSGYIFKQATLDPLYEGNRADTHEKELIARFKQDPSLEHIEGTMEKDGEEFYYFALPKKVDDKKCLRCHGDPANAPKDQIEIYGTQQGYHWKLDDVVSTYIVYVSMSNAIAAARTNAMYLVLIGAGSFFIAIMLIWIFLDRSVVRPIIGLSNLTNKISLGEKLDQNVPFKSDDEIGMLARGIDRLRISMLKMMERCKSA